MIHKTSLNITLKSEECKSTLASFEHLACKMSVNSLVVDLVFVYRPPPSRKNKLTPNLFYDEFVDFLSNVTMSNNPVLIAGDINIAWNSDYDKVRRTKDALKRLSLHQMVSEPTHIKGNIIDWIICKPATIVSEVHVADLISDHFAVRCSLNTTKPPIGKAQLTYRKLKNILQDKFDSDILKSELLTRL